MKMSSFGLYLLCFFFACAKSISVDQIDVAAIKGSRDAVPAEEILEIIHPFLEQRPALLQGSKCSKNDSAVLNLISNLGFTASSTGKSFSITTNKVATWIEAWSGCIANRKQFATVESAAEQLQILQLMFTQGISSYYVWLAGIDISTGGVFSWVGDACGVSMNYTNWMSGAPADDDDHCLATSIAGWNNIPCTDTTYYVCQS